MAARVLSTIKNQYPDNYNENNKKEQLVRTILSKIDNYSNQINGNTAANITQTIIKEIVAENHPVRNRTKVSGPAKPKNNYPSQNNFMLNPDFGNEPQMSKMSQVSFERNNLNGGRPNMMSQRPQPSANNNQNKSVDRRQQMGMVNQFIPVNREYEDFENDYRIGFQEDDNIQPVENRYEQMLKERQHEMGQMRQRPSTPDFSLDGSGKRRKEEDMRRQQQIQTQSQSLNKQQTQTTQNNFTHNPQAQYGIIGSNELPQNNSGFSSFDNIDEGFSNIDIMNTGINPNDVKFNDNISVDARLRQLQNDRGTNISVPNSSVSKNMNQNQNLNQNQNQVKYDPNIQTPSLPPPLKTSVRENQNQDQSNNDTKKPVIRENFNQNQFNSNSNTGGNSVQNQNDGLKYNPNIQGDIYSMVNDHLSGNNRNQISFNTSIPQQAPMYSNQSSQNQSSQNLNQSNQYTQNQPNQSNQYQNQSSQNQFSQNQSSQNQSSQNQFSQNQSSQNQSSQNQSSQNQFSQNQSNQSQSDQNNQLLVLLMQQQKTFQEEILRLHEKIQNLNQPFVQQYNDINSELEQYKEVNNKLQDRIVELQNQLKSRQVEQNNQDISDPKISQLQKVKEETMQQIEKLKRVQEEIGQKVSLNKSLESTVKKIISDNASKFENSEENIFISSQYMTLPNTLKNITSIELKEIDLPFGKYVINPNNNRLHFRIKTGSSDELNSTNQESDTADLIDSDIDGLVETTETDNILELIVIMGNYTIEKLLEILNLNLLKHNIKISHNKTADLITFKSINNFDLVFGQNSMLHSFGFNINNQSKYCNSNKYSGAKALDFKPDRYINIFISNINDSKPFYQYITNQPNQNSKKTVFNPIISELSEIRLKFIDSKGKELIVDPDNGFEFNITATIRCINSDNTNIINNESNEVSSDDLYTLVTQQISR